MGRPKNEKEDGRSEGERRGANGRITERSSQGASDDEAKEEVRGGRKEGGGAGGERIGDNETECA
eukprot:1698329-Pleurochrysis_carterae.AAC.2